MLILQRWVTLSLGSNQQEFLKPLITPYEAYVALAKYVVRRHSTQSKHQLTSGLLSLLARPAWDRNGISTGELVTDFQELRSVLHAAADAAVAKAAQSAAGEDTEDEEPSFSLIRQAYRTPAASATDAASGTDSTAVAVRPDGSALVHYTQRMEGLLRHADGAMHSSHERIADPLMYFTLISGLFGEALIPRAGAAAG